MMGRSHMMGNVRLDLSSCFLASNDELTRSFCCPVERMASAIVLCRNSQNKKNNRKSSG